MNKINNINNIIDEFVSDTNDTYDTYDDYADTFKNNKKYLIQDYNTREANRYKNVIHSYGPFISKKRIKSFSKKMVSTRKIKYSLLFVMNEKEYYKEISPQCMHNVGKFYFNLDGYGNIQNSSTITLKCKFEKGKFKKRMTPLINLLGINNNEICLDIRFGIKHFNKMIGNVWNNMNHVLLEYDEYYLQMYHSINNELIFQIFNNKYGYLVGELNPLKGKYEADFFKNFLQIDQKKIIKYKNLAYF